MRHRLLTAERHSGPNFPLCLEDAICNLSGNLFRLSPGNG